MLRRVTDRAVVELLEKRQLFSAAFDVVQLSTMRNDPVYAGVDGSGIGVAVIDTGTYAAHPDLRNNFKAYYDAVSNGPVLTNVDDAGVRDPGGHGTHVAGTAVSSNPEIGVAPAAGLIGIRGLTAEGEAYPRFDPVLQGLRWVLANHEQFNIKVVNMSLGVYSENINSELPASDESRVIDQLEAVGITVVSAMGNGYGGFVAPGSSTPGVYSTIQVANTWEDSGTANDRNVIGLDSSGKWGVIDNQPVADQLSASSQRSTLPNSVAAPGTTIYSTWNGDGGLMYNTIRGTSMASPLVAGAVALMQDAAMSFGGRYLAPADVLQIIRQTADAVVDQQTPGTSRIPLTRDANGQPVQAGPAEDIPETGNTYLRINVYKAMQRVRDLVTNGGTNPPQEPPPTDPGTRVDDTNHTTASAIALPSLDATSTYTATGNVGTDGQVNVGPNDIDLYKITLESPGVASFAFSGLEAGLDLYPRLFDAAGMELAFAGNTATSVTTQQLAAGTYYFGVSSETNTAYDINAGTGATNGASTGAFTFTVGLINDDPNGVFQGAVEVDLTNPDTIYPVNDLPASFFTGNIDSDPNPVDPAGDRIDIGATDVDMFRVIAPDSGTLTIDIDAIGSTAHSTDGVDSYVKVFRLLDDGTVELVTDNDDEGAGNTDSYLQLSLEEGQTYFVAVTTYGNRNFDPADPFNRTSEDNETGLYDMYLSFENGDVNGTLFGAVDLLEAQQNGVVLGQIGADFGAPLAGAATNGGYKDVDFFTYTAPTDGLLDVTATSDNMNPTVALWQLSDDGTDVVRVGGDASTGARVVMMVTAGQEIGISATGEGNGAFNWFAPASGTGGDTGTYELTAVLRDPSDVKTNDSVNGGTPEALPLNTPMTRNLGFDGPLANGEADVDLYQIVAGAAGNYTFIADTSAEHSADTVLRVFNSAGQEIAFNDNASATTNGSELTVTLAAGQTYYVGVSGAGASARSYDPITGNGAGPGSRGNYVLFASTDAVVTEPAPDLTAVVAAPRLFTTLVPLDRGVVDVRVSNAGDLTFRAAVGVDVYMSTDQTLDGNDVLVGTMKPRRLAMRPDATKLLRIRMTVPANTGEGTYYLLANVDPANTVVEKSEANNVAVDATPRELKWQFGNVGARRNVRLTLSDGADVPVTFYLRGPGTGQVTRDVNDGIFDLSFTGTTTRSSGSLRSRGVSAIDDISIAGDFRTFTARTVDLLGEVITTGVRGNFRFRNGLVIDVVE
ncbi:MAG TPA: S8 family serine peptidase [Tepidisphaeraceae bacterium]|nr:S8 family serine peptidase [Tepidisphaeraceae bacterium]